MKQHDFSLIGMTEVRRKMNALTDAVVDPATRKAMRLAAGIVARAARRNAMAVDNPNTGRRIRDNVRLQFAGRVFRQKGIIMYRVGVATEKGRIPSPNADTGPRGNTPHWHLVEFGTSRSLAKPFMRPALSNNVDKVINRFMAELDKELGKVLS